MLFVNILLKYCINIFCNLPHTLINNIVLFHHYTALTLIRQSVLRSARVYYIVERSSYGQHVIVFSLFEMRLNQSLRVKSEYICIQHY